MTNKLIINGASLLEAAPIKNMVTCKMREHGVSYGLTEAGYDIRIKQDIFFNPTKRYNAPKLTDKNIDLTYPIMEVVDDLGEIAQLPGRFTLASAIEEFDMPINLVGEVKDKSTWARQGLSVFNTVIEPGWKGFLTLELVFHGNSVVHIPAGSGIAQVLFYPLTNPGQYEGKYQNQEDRPVASIFR